MIKKLPLQNNNYLKTQRILWQGYIIRKPRSDSYKRTSLRHHHLDNRFEVQGYSYKQLVPRITQNHNFLIDVNSFS